MADTTSKQFTNGGTEDFFLYQQRQSGCRIPFCGNDQDIGNGNGRSLPDDEDYATALAKAMNKLSVDERNRIQDDMQYVIVSSVFFFPSLVFNLIKTFSFPQSARHPRTLPTAVSSAAPRSTRATTPATSYATPASSRPSTPRWTACTRTRSTTRSGTSATSPANSSACPPSTSSSAGSARTSREFLE